VKILFGVEGGLRWLRNHTTT